VAMLDCFGIYHFVLAERAVGVFFVLFSTLMHGLEFGGQPLAERNSLRCEWKVFFFWLVESCWCYRI